MANAPVQVVRHVCDAKCGVTQDIDVDPGKEVQDLPSWHRGMVVPSPLNGLTSPVDYVACSDRCVVQAIKQVSGTADETGAPKRRGGRPKRSATTPTTRTRKSSHIDPEKASEVA